MIFDCIKSHNSTIIYKLRTVNDVPMEKLKIAK